MQAIRVIFVAPYHGMEQEIAMAFSQFGRPEVEYRTLLLSPDEERMISRFDREADVIISRGLAAAFFRTLKIPTVELNTSGYDLILAVQKAVKTFHSTHAAVIGTESMLFDTQRFSTLFPGITVECCPVSSRDEITSCIQAARARGAQVLIGGRSLMERAACCQIPCVMIENSRESILQSIQMAVQLVEATRAERAEADRISKIMDYSFSGILSTDAGGVVCDINRKACAILGIDRARALERHISQIFPELGVDAVIRRGVRLLDELYPVGGNVVSVNCVPIEGEKENLGAVITCQAAGEVQKTESKIRKKILQKGFVAHYHFSDIIGEAPLTRAVLDRAARFSGSQANVLLYGETGVGKELFAQSIHNASARRDGPFVAINCAALPEQLLESELFGYAEGAFTGAAKGGKTGLFELAHCGTIFLDEIGDLSLKLQARLLRVLQEREIVRLGGDRVIPVDVRVVSATNKDLSREVERGNFRQDLMYRLDVLRLTIPPLRQRKEDIIPLFWEFLREYCEQEGKACFRRIRPEAARLLREESWKGNIRQLRSVAQRLSILWDDAEISAAAVCEALGRDGPPEEPAGSEEDGEAGRIRAALARCGYKKGEAARQLGMDRTTLWRKMKKYGIR